ncbi:4Fe-4S dicluster domain-containing protein [Geobacter sp. FeAm09]|uniref:4Fe-4S binding protein n=1 Tax=Geobacter sp. FeAm09 TaxID=2597769 RepID=UPI0011EE1859|nr:4Fe-4S binding protein [Geobacter sp. FeAm09]QEM68536.1 4Fe-4S dicluster domain-containing protein [Geobacter sp. FeAm09]
METARSGAVLNPAPPVPRVAADRCSGCGRCVSACLLRLVTLEPQGYRKAARIVSAERCTGCGACVASCPIGALVAGSVPTGC